MRFGADSKAYLNRLNSLNERMRTSESEIMTDIYAKALVMTKLCYLTIGGLFDKIFDMLKQFLEEAKKDGEFYNELPKEIEKLEKHQKKAWR